MSAERERAALSLDQVVGRRIHMEMWDRKVTQSELARRIGIDQSGLSKRLRGERSWGLDELELVALELRVDVAELLQRDWYTPRDLNPEPTDLGTACDVVCIDDAPSLRLRLASTPEGGEAA